MIRTILLPSAAALLLLGAPGCAGESPSTAADPPPALSSIPHSSARGIQDLGTFGWDHGFGFEINERGEIAGRTDMGAPVPTAVHAVFWSPRTGVVDLGTLGGALSETRALNDHGLVVGLAQKAGETMFTQRHPTVWKVSPGGVQTIELGPFGQGQAEDVNNRGVVVGWSAASPVAPPTAFRWSERTGIEPIPPLAGPRSMAAGINEAGDVVGNSSVSAAPPFIDHAVVWWRNGRVTDIGTLGSSTTARSINDHGEVVGFGQPCPGCPQRPFYWSAETGIVDLGTPPGMRSFAFEIDNHGRVAGWYESPPGVPHAFIWTLQGGIVPLPTLGGAISSTGSINGRGQVTGRAQTPSGAVHAVIWQLGPD
jgi:probable HAF family extracellular repeat protein